MQAWSALENYMGEVYRGIDCKVSHELYQVRACVRCALRASVVIPVRLDHLDGGQAQHSGSTEYSSGLRRRGTQVGKTITWQQFTSTSKHQHVARKSVQP